MNMNRSEKSNCGAEKCKNTPSEARRNTPTRVITINHTVMKEYTVIEVANITTWRTVFETIEDAKEYMTKEIRANQGTQGVTQHIYLTQDGILVNQWHRDRQRGK